MSWDYSLQLIGPQGTVDVDSADVGFDETWVPFGQGSVTVPLEQSHVSLLAATPFAPLTLRITANDYTTTPTASKTIEWQFVLQSVSEDHDASTMTLRIATAELPLMETRNGDPDRAWTYAPDPVGLAFLLFDTAEWAGLPLDMGTIAPGVQTVPKSQVQPFTTGESVWQWWDGLRMLADARHNVEIETGRIGLEPARPVQLDVNVPPGWIARNRTYLPEPFADAVTIAWRDPELDEIVSQETVYASSLDDWRAAKRHISIERLAPVKPGYAQRMVNATSKARTMDVVALPLQYGWLKTSVVYQYPAVRFRFDDEPTVTFTLYSLAM